MNASYWCKYAAKHCGDVVEGFWQVDWLAANDADHLDKQKQHLRWKAAVRYYKELAKSIAKFRGLICWGLLGNVCGMLQ